MAGEWIGVVGTLAGTGLGTAATYFGQLSQAQGKPTQVLRDEDERI
jgi:hypothetical protein